MSLQDIIAKNADEIERLERQLLVKNKNDELERLNQELLIKTQEIKIFELKNKLLERSDCTSSRISHDQPNNSSLPKAKLKEKKKHWIFHKLSNT